MNDATNGNGNGGGHAHRQGPMYLVTLGALGVVFGDIGTSPLYALKACLSAGGNATPGPSVR